MQAIAQWLNFSETTFIGPPQSSNADYAVRIFTLEREMPFAGHPTLGSCHAWLAAHRTPHNSSLIVQESGIGLVGIRRTDGMLAFRAPVFVRDGAVEESKILELSEVLGISREEILDARWGDNGPGWIMLLLGSAVRVKSLKPRGSHGSRVDVGVVGPYEPGMESAFEVRARSEAPMKSVGEITPSATQHCEGCAIDMAGVLPPREDSVKPESARKITQPAVRFSPTPRRA